MIKGFKAMAEYLTEHAKIPVHPDTLRKAVSDERNPLVVEWDNGFALIEPMKLMQWREKRKGLKRPNRKSA
jgi:hypothetical protein